MQVHGQQRLSSTCILGFATVSTTPYCSLAPTFQSLTLPPGPCRHLSLQLLLQVSAPPLVLRVHFRSSFSLLDSLGVCQLQEGALKLHLHCSCPWTKTKELFTLDCNMFATVFCFFFPSLPFTTAWLVQSQPAQ